MLLTSLLKISRLLSIYWSSRGAINTVNGTDLVLYIAPAESKNSSTTLLISLAGMTTQDKPEWRLTSTVLIALVLAYMGPSRDWPTQRPPQSLSEEMV